MMLQSNAYDVTEKRLWCYRVTSGGSDTSPPTHGVTVMMLQSNAYDVTEKRLWFYRVTSGGRCEDMVLRSQSNGHGVAE
jgi:hypothetical protein